MLKILFLGPVNDVFRELRKVYKDQMTQYYRMCGLSQQRSMIGGQFTGPELKTMTTPAKLTSLASLLSPVCPYAEEVCSYLQAVRDLHRLCVTKQLQSDYKEVNNTYIAYFIGQVSTSHKVVYIYMLWNHNISDSTVCHYCR